MSIEAMNWALNVPLGGSQKVLLLGLANHAHPDGSHAYPSIERLSGYAHCDRSTVIRNLRKLEEAGWIARHGKGTRGQVSYRLAVRDYWCTYCTIGAAEVRDHVVPRARGGSDEPSNRAAACGVCNGSKGVRDVREWCEATGRDWAVIKERLVEQGVAICDVAPVPPEPSVVVVGEEEQQQGGEGSGERRANATDDIELVWAHYVSVMKPRNTVLDAEGRRLIRDALKVADRATLCRAIDGCFASDFHMKRGQYVARPGPRHNALSKIVKGKRGGRTTREQIDFFVDIAERSGVGPGIASVDPGIVQQRKLHVRTGLAPSAAEHLQQRGKEAEDWLAQHGIRTVYDAAGPGGVRFEADTGGTT